MIGWNETARSSAAVEEPRTASGMRAAYNRTTTSPVCRPKKVLPHWRNRRAKRALGFPPDCQRPATAATRRGLPTPAPANSNAHWFSVTSLCPPFFYRQRPSPKVSNLPLVFFPHCFALGEGRFFKIVFNEGSSLWLVLNSHWLRVTSYRHELMVRVVQDPVLFFWTWIAMTITIHYERKNGRGTFSTRFVDVFPSLSLSLSLSLSSARFVTVRPWRNRCSDPHIYDGPQLFLLFHFQPSFLFFFGSEQGFTEFYSVSSRELESDFLLPGLLGFEWKTFFFNQFNAFEIVKILALSIWDKLVMGFTVFYRVLFYISRSTLSWEEFLRRALPSLSRW